MELDVDTDDTESISDLSSSSFESDGCYEKVQELFFGSEHEQVDHDPHHYVLKILRQVPAVLRSIVSLCFVLVRRCRRLVLIFFTLYWLHFYICLSFHRLMPAHWIAMASFHATETKVCVILFIFIVLFARMAEALSDYFGATGPLWTVEFKKHKWHHRFLGKELSSRRSLYDSGEVEEVQVRASRYAFYVVAKTAQLLVTTKSAAMSIIGFLFFSTFIFIILFHNDKVARMMSLSSVCFIVLIILGLLLFSTDIMGIRWNKLALAAMLHVMAMVSQYLSVSLRLPPWRLWQRLQMFNDAAVYTPFTQLLSNRHISPSVGRDPLTYLVLVMADAALVGMLRRANCINACLRTMGTLSEQLLGISGVELLAVLCAELLPIHSTAIVLQPYLPGLSDSELTFVLCVATQGTYGSTERMFTHFGIERQRYLHHSVIIRQMSITGCLLACKILYPCNNEQHRYIKGHEPQETSWNLLPLGCLEGLHFGRKYVQLVLLSKLIHFLLYLALSEATRCVSWLLLGQSASANDVLYFLLSPIGFLLADSQEAVRYVGLLLTELTFFKVGDIQQKAAAKMWELSSVQRYFDMKVQGRDNLLIAHAFYRHSRVHSSNSSEVNLGPAFSLSVADGVDTIFSNCLFIFVLLWQFRRTCSPFGVARRCATISFIVLLFNLHLVWLVEKLATIE